MAVENNAIHYVVKQHGEEWRLLVGATECQQAVSED